MTTPPPPEPRRDPSDDGRVAPGVDPPADARASTPSPSAILDIDALRTFLAVSERGGVTAASETVGRTPAAVSMQLKKLEEMVGRRLFDRSARGMSLTIDGEQLLGYARKILGLHGDALAAFRRSPLTHAVRVGLVDDFGDLRLARVLAEFSEAHPDATVTVALGPTEMLFKALDAGELDVALLTPGGATSWRSGDILAHEEQLIWAGCAGGRAHQKDPLPLAISGLGCAWRAQAIDALSKSGRRYRIAYTSALSLGQRAAIAADLAVAPLAPSIMSPGFEMLGPEHGLPPIGRCQLVLRFGVGRRTATADAIGDRILAAFQGAGDAGPLGGTL